ncbi:MAG: hypothetical protein NXI22_07680 [bacterium]|nr:hypothetical protein [bacterium]
MKDYYRTPNTSDVPKPVAGLTTAETTYLAIVFVCGAFYIVPLAIFHLILIATDHETSIYFFMVIIMWLYLGSLTVTSAINLWRGSLVTGITIFQIGILCLTLYFIPIAIWGGFLLYFQRQRRQPSEQASV